VSASLDARFRVRGVGENPDSLSLIVSDPVPADASPDPPAGRPLAGGKLMLDEPAAGVARLTIHNPEKRNALDHEVLDAITQAVAGLDARCLILTGSKGMFSAGYDIGEIGRGDFEREAEALVAHPFTAAIEAVHAYRGPTLAALSGHAIGGGLELALACDLRIASLEIKLGMPPAKLGRVYSHTGIRRFLTTIGAPRTRELFLLGENIDAPTALNWGLVNRVTAAPELESAALAMARALASHAPLAQSGNKRVMRALLAAAQLDPDVERELLELRRASFASADIREGVRAFAEKRPPRWQGR
jgi:enoyl-CoA hydratase/carnithine racemase